MLHLLKRRAEGAVALEDGKAARAEGVATAQTLVEERLAQSLPVRRPSALSRHPITVDERQGEHSGGRDRRDLCLLGGCAVPVRAWHDVSGKPADELARARDVAERDGGRILLGRTHVHLRRAEERQRALGLDLAYLVTLLAQDLQRPPEERLDVCGLLFIAE